MRTIGNLVWFVFGGAVMGLAWWLAGLIALLSVIGIPWAKACFVIGKLSFFPFGFEAIDRFALTFEEDIGTGAFGQLGNVIWFVFVGFWLALGHLCLAAVWFITLVGIPFGLQHVKLAALTLAPIGKTVVPIDSDWDASHEPARAIRARPRKSSRHSSTRQAGRSGVVN